MALSIPSAKTNLLSGTGATSHTTASFSVTVGDLIILTAEVVWSATFTYSAPTDTLGSLTWTKHQDAFGTASNWCRTAIWTTQATSSTSGTVTISYGGVADPGRINIQVHTVTGHNTTTPVPQSAKTENGTASTLTVTLGSTPASTSMVFGACGSEGDEDGITPGSGFTELYDSSTGNGSTSAAMQTQYDLTSADTTCDWSALSTLTNNGVAIEIAEAASAATLRFIQGARQAVNRASTY